MAKRRRGRYKMTPRRRAALRKAQMASARKRKGSSLDGVKNFARTAGAIGGTIAAGALLYHAESYARDPGKAVRHYQIAHKWVGHKVFGGPDPNAPGPRLRSRPISPHRFRPVRPLRGGVAGRRISTSQRSRLR